MTLIIFYKNGNLRSDMLVASLTYRLAGLGLAASLVLAALPFSFSLLAH